MVASLNPDYGHFDLVPFEPRIWMGGPSENCWRMYYNNSLSQWELEGGNGLVRYTQSSTFDCNGPNIFDVKLVDLTLQAPNSITVYPLSPLPCECPGMFEPNMGTLNLTGYPPTIRSHLWPTMGAFALTPYAPTIAGGVPNTSVSVTSTGGITIPSGSGMGVGGNITWTLWFKPGAGATGLGIRQKDPLSLALNFSLFVNFSGGNLHAAFRVDADIFNTYAVVGSSTLSTAGQWYLLSGVYDGSSVKVYVNGVLQGTTAVAMSRGFADNTTDFAGAVAAGWTGHMLDIRLYTAALTAGDLLTIYNGGSPSYTDGTTGYGSFFGWWKCGEGSGLTLHDSLGSKDASGATVTWVADSPP